MPGSEYHERLWESIPQGLTPAYAQLRRDFLLARVGAGDRVLDIGCGEGFFSSALLDAGARPVAIDVAEEPLRRARRRDERLQLELVAPETPLPFADAAFDAVWAGEVIEHVADTAGWLSEVRRVLRAQGTLLLSTPAHDLLTRARVALQPGQFERRFDPRSDHLRFYTRASLRALLEDFRFERIGVEGAGGLPGMRALLLVSAVRRRF